MIALRHIRFLAVLSLVLYAVAVGHQLLPHGAEHGDGERCPLCVLLFSVALLLPLAAAFLICVTSEAHQRFAAIPRTCYSKYSIPLRGPPFDLH